MDNWSLDNWNKKNGILLAFSSWAFHQGADSEMEPGPIYGPMWMDLDLFEKDCNFGGAEVLKALKSEGYVIGNIIDYGRLLSFENFDEYMDDSLLWKNP